MFKSSKSRSWTSPWFLSPEVGAAPVDFARCQLWFPASLCRTFSCAASEEDVSLREEDSVDVWEDDEEEEEV